MDTVRIRPAFRYTEKQREAMQRVLLSGSLMKLLYGGSRSGKTALLVDSTIKRALMAAESRHVIFRQKFNHVKTSIWHDTLPKIIKMYDGAEFVPNKTDFYYECQHNGSQIWIAGLDDKERVEKILGNEYATVYFNEASQMSYDAFNMAKTRAAQKVKKADGTLLPTRLYVDCNPPPKSHWIYKVFFEHIDPQSREALNPDLFASMLMNPADNLANLSEDYLNMLATLPYRQRERFLHGKFLDDIEGAYFKQADIDRSRLTSDEISAGNLERIAVAIDPAISSVEGSDETGITAGGILAGHGYLLEDASGKYSPDGWATRAIALHDKYQASCIVVELNQGGDMVIETIRRKRRDILIRGVRASKGKLARAEPISALYEQGLIHHVGYFADLEEQLTGYTGRVGEKSPDRLDSLVWLFTDLMIHSTGDNMDVLPTMSGGSLW